MLVPRCRCSEHCRALAALYKCASHQSAIAFKSLGLHDQAETDIQAFDLFFLVMEVPVRPHSPCSGMASHLRMHGWRWDEQLLSCIVAQLAEEDIYDPHALWGVELADIDESANWPTDVRNFIQKLCQVRAPLRAYLDYMSAIHCKGAARGKA